MALSFFSPPFESNLSGNIEGTSSQVGLENHVEWYGLSHEVTSPFSEQTGLPEGRPRHGALEAVKAVDRASPLLMDTLTKRGTIPKIEFKFYRPAASGEEEHFYTITLEEAQIAAIRMEQLNNRYPENMPHEFRERVSFVYDKITWEEVDVGVMSFDSWKQTKRGG